MTNFTSQARIGSTRKARQCEHCLARIEVGSAAIRCAGVFDGDFHHYHLHPDCVAAGNELAGISGNWGENYSWLHQIYEPEDARWLMKDYPAVAARLRICARIAAEDAAVLAKAA